MAGMSVFSFKCEFCGGGGATNVFKESFVHKCPGRRPLFADAPVSRSDHAVFGSEAWVANLATTLRAFEGLLKPGGARECVSPRKCCCDVCREDV